MSEPEELSEAQLWELTADEDEVVRAEAFMDLATKMHARGSYAEAVGPAAASRELFAKLDRPFDEGRASFIEGIVLQDAGREGEALAPLVRATELYRIYASEEMLADAIKKQADVLLELNRLEEAHEAFQSAIRLYESNGKYTMAGISALDLGESQGGENQQDKALETFVEALRLFKEGGDYIGSGRAHDRIAAALIDLGNLEDAISHLRESLNIFEYINDNLRIAYSRYRLGWTLVTYGDFGQAIPLLRQASQMYKERNKFLDAAQADTQLAHALAAISQEDEALALYSQTRSLYDASGKVHDALIADVNAAGRLVGRDVLAAIDIYRRVMPVAKETDDQYILMASIVRLAEALCKLGESENYAEALELLNSISPDDWGHDLAQRSRHLNVLAYTLIELNRDDDAEVHIRQVLNLGLESGFLSESAEATRMLGLIEQARGREESSNQLVAQAIALYLAAGEDEKARTLSHRLLPTATPTPQDILRSESPAIEADMSQSD